MSPDHPPEAEEDDDRFLTPTAERTAALLDPPMPSSSTTTTAPSAAVAAADDIPDHYLCPITKMIMTDPVFLDASNQNQALAPPTAGGNFS
jgi:hypothetical protein